MRILIPGFYEKAIMIDNDDVNKILDVIKMVANGKNRGRKINFLRFSDEKFDKFSDLVLNNLQDIKEQLDIKYPKFCGYFTSSEFIDEKISLILNDIQLAKSFSNSNLTLMKQLKKDLNKTNFNVSAEADSGISKGELDRLVKLNSDSINSVVGALLSLDGHTLNKLYEEVIANWAKGNHVTNYSFSLDDMHYVTLTIKDDNEKSKELTNELNQYLNDNISYAIDGFYDAMLKDNGRLDNHIELTNFSDPGGVADPSLKAPVLNLQGLSLQEQLYLIDNFDKIENKYGSTEDFLKPENHFVAVGYDDDKEEFNMY